MEDLLSEILLYSALFICSTLANLLSAISGGGAGFIQFPILILLGLPFMTALGTHKASTLLLGLGSLTRKNCASSLTFKVGLVLVLIGVPGCFMGTYLISLIDERKAELFLGVITIAMAVYSFFSKSLDSRNQAAGAVQVCPLRFAMGVVAIFLTALLSGALSSGAGLFATMIMMLFFGLDIKAAVSHAVIFVGTLWNFVGAVTVYYVASIHWEWVPTLLAASFAGGYLGSKLLNKLAPRTVRYIFAAVSLISGVLLIHSSIG